MDKIVLFGAGERGVNVYHILKENGVICFVDNDKQKIGEYVDDLKIESPDILEDMPDANVVITINLYKDIAKQLVDIGIRNIFIINERFKLKKVAYGYTHIQQLKKKEISMGKLFEQVCAGGGIILDNVSFRSGGSGALDYAFLKCIMQYFKLENYLEIGTYIGESINNVSSVSKRCYSISVPPEHPASMKNFCVAYGIKDFSNRLLYPDNIIQYLADSKEFDFNKIEDRIDLYFIDGDHSMSGIEKDTQKVFAHKSEDSFVVWHDVKEEGHSICDTTVSAVFQAIGDKGMENFYIVDANRCGIYVPSKYRSFFDKLCKWDEDILYTYKLCMQVEKR